MPRDRRTVPAQLDFRMLTAEWPDVALETVARLRNPQEIQGFLDQTPYAREPVFRSPLSVLRDRRAHCLDAALFAAAVLRQWGLPPLVLDLRAEGAADHVIAPFRVNGLWGAIAKSEDALLGFRPPLYRTLRELALAYAPFCLDAAGLPALRSYSPALDLRRMDALGWLSEDAGLETIAAWLDRARHTPLVAAPRSRSEIA